MDVRNFSLSFSNVWSVRFLVISQELSLKRKQNILFLVIFSCNLYISYITTTDLCKVLYSENLESQENIKIKRSTTSIKTQGYVYPHEISISFIIYSSIKNRVGFFISTQCIYLYWQHIWQLHLIITSSFVTHAC
jgi:hypothetical protein